MPKPRWRLMGAALALTAVACAGESDPLPPVPTPAEAVAAARVQDFFDAVRPLVGKAPLECNSDVRRSVVPRVATAPPATLAEWFACAQDARAARRPFLIVLEHPPFEGWNLTGVLGQ